MTSTDLWTWITSLGPAFVILGLDVWALVRPGKPLVVPYQMYEDMRAQRDRALKLLDQSTDVMQTTLEKMGDLLSVLKVPDDASLSRPLPRQHRSTKEGP